MPAVEDFFGAIAPEYDAYAQRGMPRYGEMLSEILRYLPDSPRDVLELGCGTGMLTSPIAQRFPDASLTAVDAAPEMIDVARRRLAARQVSFVGSMFEDLQLAPAGFDLITSNMSLHHIAEKGPFYRRLRAALRPGGFLIFGDELKGALPRVQQLNWDGWLEFARQPEHLTEEEIAATIRHEREFDHYETLPDQIALLRGAGFDPVDCVWRYRIYGVFVAQA